MFRSRAILAYFSFLTENLGPAEPPPGRKGITILIRAIITPQDRERHEKKLELIPGELGLKYINDDDKKYFEGQYFRNKKLRYEQMVIEWRHEKLDSISDSNNPLFKAFTALRLYKEGPVFIRYIYTIDEESGVFVGHSNFEVPGSFMDYHEVFIYDLGEEEIPSFKEIFELLNSESKLDDSTEIALDRFGSTYYPKAARDVLLDIMIAFEALFLSGYRYGAKGGPLAIACSMLLGKTKDERKTIKETLEKFYDIRNDIVHGSSYDEDIIKEKFYILRNYLRRSIIILLN